MNTERRTAPMTPEPERFVHAVVRKLRHLDRRVDFLEKSVLPGLPAPTALDLEEARAARENAVALSDEIASIGDSLDSVIAALDAKPTLRPVPPPTPATKAPSSPHTVRDRDQPVVDLTAQPRRTSWRDPNRTSGWQPAPRRTR